MLSTVSVGASGSSGSGTSILDAAGERRAVESTRQPSGILTSMPPNSAPSVRCASGASFTSRRSTAMPPYQASMEPPRNACARLFELDAAEDRGERDLVALLVAARRQHALHERAAATIPAVEAEKEPERPRSRIATERTAASMARDGDRRDPSALEQAFPEAAELSVEDRTGTGDHFQVTVAIRRSTASRSSTSTGA